MKAKAGIVYVRPSWSLLDVRHEVIRVTAVEDSEWPAAPIDYFLHSLAEDQGECGVGVILSGIGSDGTLGLKAISDAGGITFAQRPESAKCDRPRGTVSV